MTFEELRIKHDQLIYNGFNISLERNNLKVVFDFVLSPDIDFRPEIIFENIPMDRFKKINPLIFENLFFNLGIVELLSYWKAACPVEIIIKAGFLNADQIKFWKNLLIKGLGEFFYKNKIDFTSNDLVDIKVEADPLSIANFDGQLQDRDLILVGGGKDSAVTLDILSKSGREYNCFSLNPTNSARQIIKIAGCNNPIFITRIIDPKLLELNKSGYLNGHTPFSAYLAFLSVIASVVYDYKNLIVSNEASSNEGNTVWMGQEVNHQYSKTFEFEQYFRQYCKQYLSSGSNYFSFLRPLCELQISKLFADSLHFYNDFRSCNIGSKKGVWCGKCPKCVSTYLCLYPFLGDRLAGIFGRNLLLDKDIIPVIEDLLRLNSLKPFECVATVEEIKLAIYLGIEYAKSIKKDIPACLQRMANFASNNINILNNWNNENNLPALDKIILQSRMNEAG